MGKIKHVALFSFKENTRLAEIDFVFESIRKLTETLPGIEDYAAGPGTSSENGNQGFTHGFVMTFTDGRSRDAYLTNADHERVQGEVLPFIDRAVIFDFEV